MKLQVHDDEHHAIILTRKEMLLLGHCLVEAEMGDLHSEAAAFAVEGQDAIGAYLLSLPEDNQTENHDTTRG